MPPIFFIIILLYIQKLVFFSLSNILSDNLEYSSNLLRKLSTIENNKHLLYQFWIFF